ncbi:MAG TPA: glycerol-3-phosphate 1-O-acyltransferase PlsY [Fimbriimonadales bacterium]|nr:glycerol-3-phosphate 1-O-acyltransferase PlsY [Fimbriimonadales bacterium]
MTILTWVLTFLITFIIGSLPFGYWVANRYGVDIRTTGSRNIGATNVFRVLGWKPGLAVLVFDIAKGYFPALLGGNALSQEQTYQTEVTLLVGLFAVLGHVYSPWLGFRGGKGVATALGVVLAATPLLAGICLAIWLLVFLTSKYVSLASILASIAAPISAFFLGYSTWVIGIYTGTCVFLILKHRANIQRLIAGKELRINFRSVSESLRSKEKKTSES